MSTFSKKFVSAALTATTSMWMASALFLAPVASAQSTADLQAQINLLLAQITALQAQLAGSTSGGATVTFTRDLTVGSTGSDVKALQQFLNTHGAQVAASGAGSPGNETSYFGNLTRAAVAKYQAMVGISPAVGYFGPKTRAYVNSLGVVVVPPGGGTGGGTTSGFRLALSSANPASATVPKGASGVVFLKFDVIGTGSVDSLTFKRTGIGATGDFSSGGVYLYEGSTRLTNGKSLNSTTHEVSFVNLGLTVSGTRTLSLVADISTSSTASNKNAFMLTGATGSPTPTGSLVGNEMTIGGQTVGTVTIDDQSAPANPKIGQKKAPLLEFQLSAGSAEDILINRVSLTEGGSIANSNLSNFVLEQAGNVVATASAVGAKDLVTLNFTTPFSLEKGQNRNFILYGDIGGSTRAADTIIFYVDTKSDVSATGKTYGFAVTPDISAIDTTSESDTLTVQGGDVTITFNGPIAGDIALRAQDVTVYDFTIASQNNIEIKNLRLHATTTALGANEGFNDFKVWDVSANSVISSAVDVTTSSAVTVTDVINISAGQSKRMKVTVDVDSDDDASDSLVVSLLAFNATDIRNLDNNTNVATSTIVPSAQIAGNTQTVQAPGLTAALAGSPASQSVVKGATNVPLAGFSFRASNDAIKITSITVSASTSNATGTISTLLADLLNIALYDGTTRISDVKSFSGSALPATAVFSNLNYTIAKGETKVLTLKANVGNSATVDAAYFAYIATLASDVSAVDSSSNAVTATGVTANSGATVAVTVLNAGDVTVVAATADNESKPGIVLAGQEVVLGKFKFTASNEAMTVNKLKISVIDSASSTATSTNTIDEVSTVKLYDGSTQVGAVGGYSLDGSGNSAGVATIEGLGWTIPKNEERTLVVKAPVSAIDLNSANGADAGTSVYANVMTTGFEAAGSTALDTSIAGATGLQKVVYRGKPTVTVNSLLSSVFNTNPVVARFRVAAGATPISFKSFSLKVEPTGATMTAATTSNVTVYDITQSASTALTLATAVSGSTTASTGSTAIVGGATGYVTVYFTTAEEIAANSYSDYDVLLTFSNISGTVGAAQLSVKLNVAETSIPTVGTFASIGVAGDDGNPSFIWSDNSKLSHSETTADWTSGYLTELPVSSPWLLHN